MKHIDAKSLLLITIFFVLLFVGLKSHDNDTFRVKQNRLENNNVTVQDLLFVYKNCGVQVDIDSFYGNIKTPFRQVISPTKSKQFYSNSIYANYCSSCHSMGVMGAPKSLPSKKIEILVNNAKNGYIGDLGQMPPFNSMCDTCTDEQLKATILWMKNNLK